MRLQSQLNADSYQLQAAQLYVDSAPCQAVPLVPGHDVFEQDGKNVDAQ